VLKRIHVDYSGVEVPADKQEAADRALATHQQACPVSRSIEAAIEVTTAWAAGDPDRG
jgi:organic hydroperoxide reductase OsmC/OhrA